MYLKSEQTFIHLTTSGFSIDFFIVFNKKINREVLIY